MIHQVHRNSSLLLYTAPACHQGKKSPATLHMNPTFHQALICGYNANAVEVLCCKGKSSSLPHLPHFSCELQHSCRPMTEMDSEASLWLLRSYSAWGTTSISRNFWYYFIRQRQILSSSHVFNCVHPHHIPSWIQRAVYSLTCARKNNPKTRQILVQMRPLWVVCCYAESDPCTP